MSICHACKESLPNGSHSCRLCNRAVHPWCLVTKEGEGYGIGGICKSCHNNVSSTTASCNASAGSSTSSGVGSSSGSSSGSTHCHTCHEPVVAAEEDTTPCDKCRRLVHFSC